MSSTFLFMSVCSCSVDIADKSPSSGCYWLPHTLGDMIYPVDSTIVSVKSKLRHTLRIPQAFETFAILGEGNLITSLLGGGEFDPHA